MIQPDCLTVLEIAVDAQFHDYLNRFDVNISGYDRSDWRTSIEDYDTAIFKGMCTGADRAVSGVETVKDFGHVGQCASGVGNKLL